MGGETDLQYLDRTFPAAKLYNSGADSVGASASMPFTVWLPFTEASEAQSFSLLEAFGRVVNWQRIDLEINATVHELQSGARQLQSDAHALRDLAASLCRDLQRLEEGNFAGL